MEDPNDLRCPFCNDNGFDIYGLKFHLQLWCDKYKNLTLPKGVINLAACDYRRKERNINDRHQSYYEKEMGIFK